MIEQKEIELEQYKIFIESTEKNSDRRINQNNIYLTINLAFISYICTQKLDFKFNVVMLIVGLIICVIWFLTIDNYSKRNKVKFDIINESQYGTLYKEEWKRISILSPLTLYEKMGSVIFAILYIALFVIKII